MDNLKVIQSLEIEYGSLANVPENDLRLKRLQRNFERKFNEADKNKNGRSIQKNEKALRDEIIIQLHKTGYGPEFIAKQMILSKSTINDIVLKAGLRPNKRFYYVLIADGKEDVYFTRRTALQKFISQNLKSKKEYHFEFLVGRVYKADLPRKCLYFDDNLKRKGQPDENIERY